MTEARFLHDGRAVHFISTDSLAAGTVVVLNKLVGVTKLDVAAGELGVLALDGVYEVHKDASVFAVGDFAYWDQTAHKVTATATGNIRLGRVISAATAAEEQVQVRLEPITA